MARKKQGGRKIFYLALYVYACQTSPHYTLRASEFLAKSLAVNSDGHGHDAGVSFREFFYPLKFVF